MYPTSQQTDSQQLCRRIVNFLIQRGVECRDELRLTAQGGVVVVGGSLPSDTDRRLCVECCRRTAGVVRVVDRTCIARIVRARRLRPVVSAPPSRRMLMRLNT